MSILDPLFINPIWENAIFGNSFRAYAVAGIALLAILIVFKFIQVVIITRLRRLSKKTKTDIDDTLIEIVGSVRPPLYVFLALYFSLRFLAVHPTLQKVIDFILLIWLVYQAIVAAQIVIDYFLKRGIKKDNANKNAIKFLSNLGKAGLWVLGLLLVLQNSGVNVSSLIAGLGIGGIAIALAVQNILGDLFSSFAIYFDKPFVVGDFIRIGERAGTVEKIGIKTTRIRAPQGEEIVIANKELTSAQIQNFKRLKERRASLKFGVLYDTPNEKMDRIPGIVKGIVESVKGVRFERAHFTTFGESSLDFEATYYVESDVYMEYMDAQQKVNLALKSAFEGEGIEMAYPTRTVYVNRA